jgi:hypothetical protein
MKETITLWFKNNFREIEREELKNFLLPKSVLGKARFAYDDLFYHLENITCIQIYQDKVVRLHLKCEPYQKNKSVFLRGNQKEGYVELVDQLILLLRKAHKEYEHGVYILQHYQEKIRIRIEEKEYVLLEAKAFDTATNQIKSHIKSMLE